MAFTVQFPIYRQHFKKLQGMPERDRVSMTKNLVEWYDQWKKPLNGKDGVAEVDGVGSRIKRDYIYEGEFEELER